ncbi:hypothetical protein ONE63_004714 [Megalurothrips usitatus]|uniref:Uncharacterized protein n=1 Tax=Megalurothrips usitatus TaxID=439358 RepID=A0AAV7X460_9NEOP|nr:hypothetical protein ONE63_004714 [Megalurothrips usitatus]
MHSSPRNLSKRRRPSTHFLSASRSLCSWRPSASALLCHDRLEARRPSPLEALELLLTGSPPCVLHASKDAFPVWIISSGFLI